MKWNIEVDIIGWLLAVAGKCFQLEMISHWGKRKGERRKPKKTLDNLPCEQVSHWVFPKRDLNPGLSLSSECPNHYTSWCLVPGFYWPVAVLSTWISALEEVAYYGPGNHSTAVTIHIWNEINRDKYLTSQVNELHAHISLLYSWSLFWRIGFYRSPNACLWHLQTGEKV